MKSTIQHSDVVRMKCKRTHEYQKGWPFDTFESEQIEYLKDNDSNRRAGKDDK